jgi:NAD(P)-dependent dehydrogenase (short-subunit alcohol dehydrogenase family)
MKTVQGKLAVVTGAGSGIGRATALALAEAGAHVAATDRDEEAAAATAREAEARGARAMAMPMDVADREQVERVASVIRETLGEPAILVNNAGIGVGGMFLDTSLASWDRVVAVNLMGVVHCCHAFLPGMVATGQPAHVVNVSSMLGYTQGRGVSAYCATKFGVLGFSECLRAELVDHGIGVSVICPGIVRTNIIRDSVLESSEHNVEEKRAEVEKLYRMRNYSPDRVARAILKAVRRNRAVVPVTAEARVFYYARRWLPWLVQLLLRRDLVQI